MNATAPRARLRPARAGNVSAEIQSISAAARVQVPPPVTATNRGQVTSQEVARVELMMLKGVRRPEHLMATLGLPSVKHAESLISQVQARWEITGSDKTPTRHRGEAFRKLDLIESELWVQWSNAEGYKAQTAIMSRIMDAVRLRTEIAGLTPRVIERMAMMPDATNDLAARVTAQANVASIATRFAEILAERRRALGMPELRTIDHDAVTTRPQGLAGDDIEDAEA